MKNWIKLTSPEKVNAKCIVVDHNTRYTFTNFVTVGFTDEGEVSIVAADLQDLARGIQMLSEIYHNAYQQASPEIQRKVSTDLIIEASLRRNNEDE